MVELGLPGHGIFPLTDSRGEILSPVVKKGAQIKAGQLIAQGSGRNAFRLFATASGTVEKIDSSGSARNIRIALDGYPLWERIESHQKTAGDPPPELIEAILAQSGIPGIPTRFGSAEIGASEVEAVILNGLGADVYNPSLSAIVGSRFGDLAASLRLLRRIYPAASFAIAFDEREKALLARMRAEASQDWISFHLLKPKFPQQMDEMLLPVVLGKPFPHGFKAINAGVLVMDLQTALAIYDAVIPGKPAIERVVALCGPGFKENLHLRARIGTPIADIVKGRLKEGSDWRLVEDSLMLGKTIVDAANESLGRQCSAIIAIPDRTAEGFLPFASPGFRHDSFTPTFVASLLPLKKRADTNLHGEERACLSCGFCQDVCPARIMPNLLHRYVRRGFIDEAILRYRINDCIDCKLCSYVCTSKIDVAAFMKEGKAKLLSEGFENPESAVIAAGLKGIARKEEKP